MRQTNLNIKLREKFIKQGVKMIAPETVFFSKDTKIGKNVNIEPYVVFGKKVKIKNNVKILGFSHVEGVVIEQNCEIGPFVRLRPGTKLEKNSKVGNFVEIKKSTLKKNSKVNHLSYIGDSLIDIPVLERVGYAVSVADAKKEDNRDTSKIISQIKKNRILAKQGRELILVLNLSVLWQKKGFILER